MNSYLRTIWHSKLWLALIAGLLLGLSFPPFPFPFLTFPAFFLLFRVIDLSSSAREAAFWSYLGFLLWNIIATYWLIFATVAGGVAAILANAAVMTIPVMLQYQFQRSKLPPWLIALFQAAAWISFEYLHHHWQLSWPWLTVGNAWANAPDLIQYLSITGLWGVSFWVLFTSALGYQAIARSNNKPASIGGTVLLGMPLLSLILLLAKPTAQPTNRHQVVVVQPNFDSYHRYGGFASGSQAIEHLLRLSDSLRTSGTDLIVWPENAIQTNISNRDSLGIGAEYTKQRLSQKAREWDTQIIGGATYFEFYTPANVPNLPYYTAENRPYLPFNSALNFSPDQSIQVYRKHNLVPIVERIPYVGFLNAIDILGWVQWNQIQGYGRGKKANPLDIGETTTPALICYDSVYPSWTRKFNQQGSGYITIITNDGWWGNTSGHAQHFAYARLRAIELGRWVVRSANNGISGIIAPDGSVKVATSYKETTAFTYQVPILTNQTWYSRYGDWLAYLLLALAAGGWGYLFFRK